MKMKFKLKDVQSNPFRHMDRYPLKQEKLDALTKSIEDTEFWENIVARDMKDGTIEIAYGHHRIAALRNMFPEDTTFDFIIKDINDTNMCKIMAHENMEEWGSDAFIEQETIRAIVEGYADGRVMLVDVSKDTPKGQIRHAPSFKQGRAVPGDARPYTAAQLVDFLGWKEWKVKAALAALEKIEKGTLDEEVFKGTTTKQQVVISTEANKITRKAEHKAKLAEEQGDTSGAKKHRDTGVKQAKKVAKALHAGFTAETGTLGTRDAAEKAQEVLAPTKASKTVPDISPAAERLGQQLIKYLNAKSGMGSKLRELIKNRKHIQEASKRALQMNLRELADEANELADKLMK